MLSMANTIINPSPYRMCDQTRFTINHNLFDEQVFNRWVVLYDKLMNCKGTLTHTSSANNYNGIYSDSLHRLATLAVLNRSFTEVFTWGHISCACAAYDEQRGEYGGLNISS